MDRRGLRIGSSSVVATAGEDVMADIRTAESYRDDLPLVIKYLSITSTLATNTIKINNGTPIAISSGTATVLEDVNISSLIVVSADTVKLIYKY